MIDGMDTKYPLSVEYGDFGEAYTEVKEQTGQERYNVKIKFIWTEELGEGWKKIVSFIATKFYKFNLFLC